MSVQRHAVLIASSKFPHEKERLKELRCPENDVDGLGAVLSDPEHGGFSSVAILKNRPHHESLLKINQVLKSAAQDDLVLIYYSGHGKLNDKGRLHLATENTQISALEATSIPVPMIREFLDVASTSRVVVMLDCCYSGAAGADLTTRGDLDDQLQQVSTGRGTYLMTASTAIQVALEKKEDEYGAFTKHIINGIKSGEADLDGDGEVSMDELYKYVHDRVLDEGFQEPMKWDLNRRGNLVIAKTKSIARGERKLALQRKLYGLAMEGYVTHDLVTKALEVSALRKSELDPEQKRCDELLEEFLNDKITVGELGQRWFAAPAPTKQEVVKPPVVSPTIDTSRSDVDAQLASGTMSREEEILYTQTRVAVACIAPPSHDRSVKAEEKARKKKQQREESKPINGSVGLMIFAACYAFGILFDFGMWFARPFNIRLPWIVKGVDEFSNANAPASVGWLLLVLIGFGYGLFSAVHKYRPGIRMGLWANPLVFSLVPTIIYAGANKYTDAFWWGLYLLTILVLLILTFRTFIIQRGKES